MRNNKYSADKIAAPQFAPKIHSFRKGVITAPVYVRVKPINVCNHGCRWCVYKADRSLRTATGAEALMEPIHSDMHTGMVEKDVIPTEKMLEVLYDFKDLGVKAVTFSGGGEPLMHKDIVMFMQRCLNFKIDLSIITNGQLLSGARAEVLAYAKWVRVSMDYTNGQQMAHSRVVAPRLFDQVMTNLQTFARLKQPDCDLAVNFIVHRDNYDGLYAFAATLFDLGVENIRFSPMYCPDFVSYHEPIQEAVLEQLEQIDRLLVGDRTDRSVNTTYNLHDPAHSPKRAYTKCFFMQTVPVIGADQKVYACHNKAYDPTGCIGSIRDMRFKDLWFSPEAQHFFETLNPQCVCQHQCANDAKNHLINRLVTMNEDNFV